MDILVVCKYTPTGAQQGKNVFVPGPPASLCPVGTKKDGVFCI
ncbi:hypothetical protein BIW11_03810 [Tropilaelaps mercedesae]|uniref:Uncharacterized protein n=1 Tax=Tropilaelaps mercedesae TaxID=418985 RepID=A0A1V9XFQ6_9ACAR|nr:hypothetical protein BIW11_03810 [Tropilaelaps mercedesae]